MRPLRLLWPLAVLALLLGGVGCKGSCRKLSEQLCDCKPTSLDKEACLRDASRKADNYPTTAADEAVCESLLDKCDCHHLDTLEGKRNCGLAR